MDQVYTSPDRSKVSDLQPQSTGQKSAVQCQTAGHGSRLQHNRPGVKDQIHSPSQQISGRAYSSGRGVK